MKKKNTIITAILTALCTLTVVAGICFARCDPAYGETEDDIFNIAVGEYELDGRDVMRKANMLVLYNKDKYARNEYGYEVLVEKETNTVIAKDVVLEVRDGTYVLSGHGDAGRFLKRVEIGDRVKLQMSRITVTRHLKNSNLKKIEIENEQVDRFIEDCKSALLDIDTEAIAAASLELDGEVKEFKDYFDSLGEGVPADVKAVNSKMKSISRLIDMKYYLTIESNSVDGRAMWHAPNGSAIDESDLDGVKAFAKRLSDMGINTLYVQTFTCGMTMYYSDYLQFQNPKMATYNYAEYGNDYILALISECHRLGIEVHAWFNVLDSEMPSGEAPDYIKDEWVTVDLNGSDDGHFLDPSNAEVREFLKRVAREILTEYDFDGISYDYIRYSEAGDYEEYRDGGFSSNAIQLFSDEYGYSGSDLKADVKNDPEIRAKWHEFKQKSINLLLCELAEEIRAIDEEIVISASPFGYLSTAKSVYMQDVETWMQKGYIDVVLPMIYTDSVDKFCSLAAEYDEFSQTTLQYSGVYILYHKSTLRRNQEIIDAVKIKNVAGTSLFASQNYITDENEENDVVYQILSLSTHSGTAVSPTADPDEVLSAWREQLIDRCRRIYFDKMSASERAITEGHIAALSTELSNPADICIVLEALRSFESAARGFESRAVAERITSQIDYIYGILDAAISRQMIRYGYWDTETTLERPDPTKIHFAEDFE